MIAGFLSSVGNHLWQSTVFAAAMALLALVLKTNRAAVRYRLWLAASLKFLLPFSLLIALGRQVQWPTEHVHPTPALISAVEGFSQPFAFESFSAPRTTRSTESLLAAKSQQAAGSRILQLVLLVWFCGASVVVMLWLREWWRMGTSLKAASPVESDLPFPVLMTAMPMEPGIVGIFRPLLLLPKGLIDQLTAEQLDAVLTHELCHVRRRDNLMAAVHMVVETLFWFHPITWWIEKRLLEERERACDEEVLRRGGEPQAYAEGILSVCKFYKESALVCVSGVSGADLKRRIEDIMGKRVACKLSLSRTALLLVVGIAALAGPIAIGVVHAAQSRDSESYTISTIDVPGSSLTVASGIDITGRIVGYYIDGSATHGFLLNNGSLSTIDVPGAGWTVAFGISSTGQIVGGFGPTDAPSGRHGFLWSGGTFSSFDVPGSIDTIARGVNSRGQIVGEYTGTDGTRHGFRLSGGNYATIEVPESRTGSANSINDTGQIVGLAGPASGSMAFLFDSSSYSRIVFPSSNYTEALGLNNVGDIVGQMDSPQAPFRGFRRSGGAFTVIDLSDSAISWNARGINDLGQIVGAVTGKDGRTRGYQATPATLKNTVPNPTAITSISNTPSAISSPAIPGPSGPVGPQGPQGPPGPAGPAAVPAPAGPPKAGVERVLDSARTSLKAADSAVRTAIANTAGQRGRRGGELDPTLEKARAAIAAAIDDVAGASAFVNDHPEVASLRFPLTIKRDSDIQVDRPSLQVALNNLSAAADALRQIPDGDLGGFRTKTSSDIAAAVSIIVTADHEAAVAASERSRGGRGQTTAQTPISPDSSKEGLGGGGPTETTGRQ